MKHGEALMSSDKPTCAGPAIFPTPPFLLVAAMIVFGV